MVLFDLRDFSFWLGTSYRLKFTYIRRENSGFLELDISNSFNIERFDLRDFSFWLGTSYRLKFTIIRGSFFSLKKKFSLAEAAAWSRYFSRRSELSLA